MIKSFVTLQKSGDEITVLYAGVSGEHAKAALKGSNTGEAAMYDLRHVRADRRKKVPTPAAEKRTRAKSAPRGVPRAKKRGVL